MQVVEAVVAGVVRRAHRPGAAYCLGRAEATGAAPLAATAELHRSADRAWERGDKITQVRGVTLWCHEACVAEGNEFSVQ